VRECNEQDRTMQQECEHNIEEGAARPYSIVISLVLDCGWLRCDWPNPE
jgi:hypothetical protein